MKKSAIGAIRPTTPNANTWLAMLGACVAVPHGPRMAELASRCARARKLAEHRVHRIHRIEQKMKRRVATHLAALLFDALGSLDPKPFEDFAEIIRQIGRFEKQGQQPSLTFHSKALLHADLAKIRADLAKGLAEIEGEEEREENLKTQKVFLSELGVPPKNHDDASRERRELKQLGIKFAPGKRGRPKKAIQEKGCS